MEKSEEAQAATTPDPSGETLSTDLMHIRPPGGNLQSEDANDSNIARSESSNTGVVKSSMPAAVFNFVNSIIGAGIIGLPFALNEAGFGGGIFLLVIIAATTNFSVQLIVRRGVQVGKRNYEDLASHVLGKFGYHSVSMAMFIFAYGAMLAYLIIIGEEEHSAANVRGEAAVTFP